MRTSGVGPHPREVFAERFALLYAEAGDPPLKRVAQTVTRSGRSDDQGRPVRLSAQRISDWRRGQNVPARFITLTTVLQILIGEARKARPRPVVDGLYDLDEWRALWEHALTSPVDTTAGPPDADVARRPISTGEEAHRDSNICPFRGLAAFRPEDAAWFFGRERSTAALVARLGAVVNTGGIVMLVGSSGAGKSSLLRAGLVPTLHHGGLPAESSNTWPIAITTPGEDPVRELIDLIPGLTIPFDPNRPLDEDSLAQARLFAAEVRNSIRSHVRHNAGNNARLIFLVDQFEELFTLCCDEYQRYMFIQVLHAASTPDVSGGPAPALVVLGVRADFYGRCLDYPELAEALQDRQMVLGPMTAAELRETMAGPAKAVGLRLESGLVELVLHDLGIRSGRSGTNGRQAAYDAGTLPMLSHALLATWQHRQGGRLTIAGYRATAGIQGAVAATAERAWADLDSAGQVAARQLLLRLARVGEDTQDTRRRSSKQNLIEHAHNPAAAENALEVLARARLVTLDAEYVQITHEALLQVWPRLRRWIDGNRTALLLRQRLEEDAAAWDSQHRDFSLLYRGARLGTALQWAATAGADGPTAVARDFLTVSVRQRRRRTWGIRAAAVVVVVFALIAAVAAAVASAQRNDAIFAQVVSDADRLLDTDSLLSAQLDLVAHRLRPADQGVNSRLISTQNFPLARPLTGHTGAVYLTSFSADGHTLATASYDHTARLWDVRDPAHPTPLGQPLTGHTSWMSSAVFSPDGRTLATAGDDGTVRLWNVQDRTRPVPWGPAWDGQGGTIYLVAFGPDGRTLATANQDRTVRLWNIADPAQPTLLGTPLAGHTAAVRSVAFSPDGRTLASGSDDSTVALWNVADAAQPTSLATGLAGHTSTVHSVAFSPDGRLLATGSDDKTTRLWNVTDPTRPTPIGAPLIGHVGPVWSVTFSPEGHLLATGSSDGAARLWNIADPANTEQLGRPLTASTGGMFAVAFSPNGQMLATGSEDGIARLWSLPSTVLVGHTSRVLAVAFSSDGRTLATGSNDKTVRLWDVSGARPTPLGPPLLGHTGYVHDLTFSPDGHTLATESGDGTVRQWNISDPRHTSAAGRPITRNTRYAHALAFSPNGHILATGNTDETVQLWDVTDPTRPAPLGSPLTGHTGYINSIAFSPDGHTLVTASSDGTVRLWNVRNPAEAGPLEPSLTGSSGQVQAAVFNPDGRILATSGDDKTVRLWEVSDPARAVPLGPPLVGHTDVVATVAFSPDGRTLASGSADRTVRLWDLTDPAHPTSGGRSLAGHTGGVNSVAFSPDGRILASASEDDTAFLWDLNVDHAIQRICATTQGVLTPQQWQLHLPQLSYSQPC